MLLWVLGGEKVRGNGGQRGKESQADVIGARCHSELLWEKYVLVRKCVIFLQLGDYYLVTVFFF